MNDLHLFAGGNTSLGFYSCFDDILPPAQRRRMLYLKGGPGVGKSTLMRRMAKAAAEAGQAVEYYHCSSDPDSLDGIALPGLGWAVMDGTAPHVYDPVTPGARDTLVALGDHLDEPALKPHAKEIAALQEEISLRFRRCYSFLSAAGQLGRLCAGQSLREDRLHQLAMQWTEALPRRGGRGTCRRLFAEGFTPKGQLRLLREDGLTVHRVECPQGLCLTPLWQEISWTACWRGLPVVHLLHPLWPEELDGILLPEQGLLYIPCTPETQPEATPWQQLCGTGTQPEKERGYDRNAYELMITRALEQLAAAKALHDELESHYIAHMDFDRWEERLAGLLKELEAAMA
ncbi:MAG: hypothetical protein E7320_02230 [Clostridiales bacterium]|nr:hypothetical protein [Clostridiales bacterium]